MYLTLFRKEVRVCHHWKICRISAFLCILSVICHLLFIKFRGPNCYPTKFVRGLSAFYHLFYYFSERRCRVSPWKIFRIIHAHLCILILMYHLFWNFRVRGITPENLLGSFLHFGVFYWLFDTIFLKTVWLALQFF